MAVRLSGLRPRRTAPPDDEPGDETTFLVRRSHPETNRCSIRPLNREEAMGEVIAAAGVLFSISIFVAHAFDAYRTR